MPELFENKTIFSLLEVSKSIQKTIAERYKSLYWIKAEMNKLNHYSHSGHCYPELVEKKDGKVVAEMRSILWKSDYNRINTQFLKILKEPLRDGITILFQAGISYDPIHGFSLRIVDIDPSFALGELEKEKLESIRKLQEEGLFFKNKGLSFPIIPKRLAILSVETSKGLSDFYKIINNNPWGYLLETTLFPALLQGDKSIPSIIKTLALIAERHEDFDAVAIIRGGGGEVGLSSYNNYLLARAISIFPIPVITGIGHSTNETVSEMVAFKNAITPSELADFLIQKFHQFAIPVERAKDLLSREASRKIEQERHLLKSLLARLSIASRHILNNENTSIASSMTTLQKASERRIQDQSKSIQHIQQLVALADPKRLLQRGFSISWANGKVITSSSQVSENTTIETEFADGKVHSVVTKIEQ